MARDLKSRSLETPSGALGRPALPPGSLSPLIPHLCPPGGEGGWGAGLSQPESFLTQLLFHLVEKTKRLAQKDSVFLPLGAAGGQLRGVTLLRTGAWSCC